jgi:hypothetical protein
MQADIGQPGGGLTLVRTFKTMGAASLVLVSDWIPESDDNSK